ncbi:hypothetical protein K505DRAFT_300303 [Melanomma pulvis-pyrius CBS 109.77]|uniref:Uncharacterized protein n=1 Tax=Melanomma pulvis-pyrius CBS 109.77 TaxID=1314802 RepID=A0A6A6XIV9_9PLEO|nr:hypothetical protein K505DRAFT_300303 [Melanomma pulvis-pyrius CBS 109.77]
MASTSSSYDSAWPIPIPFSISSDTRSKAGGVPINTNSSYWARFAGFVPDPTANLISEFERLSIHQGWSRKTKASRRRFAEACEAEFDHHFVVGASKLQTWQALCVEVGVGPVPASITQCKKALNRVLVNLVNLIDHRRNPAVKLLIFQSFREFQNYTMAGRIFPKRLAKADGFLKIFLQEIF